MPELLSSPSICSPGQIDQRSSHRYTSPIQPPQAVHTHPGGRPSRDVLPTNQPHNSHGAFSPTHYNQADATFKSNSISSGGSSTMTAISSIELEKSTAKESETAQRCHKRDPEKAMGSPRASPTRLTSTADASSLAYSEGDQDDTLQLQEEKAMKIILFLAGPCVVLSVLNTMWTIISIVITLLTQPVRLCAKRPSFDMQLAGLLGPALNLQLRSIYTPLPPHADEDTSYHILQLVAVHMVSPFFSMGMMLLTWVVAVYWATSMVVGDPAGLDKRDDGRDTVLSLRRWWERWLMRGVQDS